MENTVYWRVVSFAWLFVGIWEDSTVVTLAGLLALVYVFWQEVRG